MVIFIGNEQISNKSNECSYNHKPLKHYSRVSNRRGGRNKRRGWQKSPKLINGEVGIKGEAGKSTAIRNFIEIKSSDDFVKISTTKKTNKNK